MFIRQNYLYWLEALSLCKSVQKGIVSMARLWSLVKVWQHKTECSYRVHDQDADTVRRQQTKISSLSLFKMHDDS
jgi:hypothetical protein